MGTTSSGQAVSESTVNLAVALEAASELRASGFTVVLSRTGASSVVRLSTQDVDGSELTQQGVFDDVAARAVCANLAKADLLVGIYMDSASSSDAAGSVSLYDEDRPFSAASRRFATLLETDVLAQLNANGWQIPDDGAVSDSGYGSEVGNPADGGLAAAAASYDHLLLLGPASGGSFSTPSTMPGAVIEPLCLTDPFEASLAQSTAGRAAIARGITMAVDADLLTSTR